MALPTNNRFLLFVLVCLFSLTIYIFNQSRVSNNYNNSNTNNNNNNNYCIENKNTHLSDNNNVKKNFYIRLANTLWGSDPGFSKLQTQCGNYIVSYTRDKSLDYHVDLFFDPDTINNWPENTSTPHIPRIIFTAEHFYTYKCIRFEECANRFNWTAISNIAGDVYISYYGDNNIRVNFYNKMSEFNFDKDILQPKLEFAKEREQSEGVVPLGSWFTTSCTKPGSNRAEYISEMMNNNFSIDSYGKCLNNRQIDAGKSKQFKLDLIKKYKFYFAFENSFTRGYITEKPFECLETGTVPVVMTHPFNRKYLPRGSYIFVGDFDSPIHLAQYLTYLSKNDTAYQEYFKWRTDKVVIEDWMKEMQFSSLPCSIVSLYERWKGGSLNQLQTVSVPQLQENILPRDFFFKNK